MDDFQGRRPEAAVPKGSTDAPTNGGFAVWVYDGRQLDWPTRRQGPTEVRPGDTARLSPMEHTNINVLGRYTFALPESVAQGDLRPLRDPAEPEA